MASPSRSGWGGGHGSGGAGITRGTGGGWVSESGADPSVGLVALVNRVDRARRASLLGMGLALERQIKVELSKPGRGRVYLRKGSAGKVRLDAAGRVRALSGRFATKMGKGRHVASAPGDPPAVDKGALRSSVGHELEDLRGSVRVGTNSVYAEPLEKGTTSAGKSRRVVILPRPFMAPAVEKVRAAFNGIITSMLRGAGDPKGGV
jgi:hypothetical protein